MKDFKVEMVRGFAQDMYVRYGGSPIYLVGAAVHSVTPRDVDIVAVMDTADFEHRFNVTAAGWRYNRGLPYLTEVGKMNRQLQDDLPPGIGADFKVYPLRFWEKEPPFLCLCSAGHTC